MANSRTAAVSSTEDGNLPEPDLPHRSFAQGVSVPSFISLRFKHSYIQIRQQELHFTRTPYMVSQRSVNETARNKHPSHQQSEVSQMEVNNGDSRQCNLRRKASADCTLRLETFGSWPHRFLDPAVLAEAKFCYTGHGDTVKCTRCGGELSNLKLDPWRRSKS